jgi:peptidoglycan/LPS O-acetylase OafA/YrhL
MRQKMKHLSDFVSGRDNNLNLIRFLAAFTVVFAHSFIVMTGQRDAGPLIESTGHDLGYHAVNVFFVASGFLIAQSWNLRPSLSHFAAGRFLRLWPALVICGLFVAFIIGPMVTTLPLAHYFAAPATYEYLPRVLSLIKVDSPLPGVMTTLPSDTGIDAPLWTLKYEALCYLSLALFGLVGGFASPSRFWAWIAPIMILLAATSFFPIARDLTHPYAHFVRFGLCFGLGTIAYVSAARLPMTVLAIPVSFGAAVLLRETPLYELALVLFTAYATLWLAFVPASFIRRFNRLGDYSYGIYIYAYPIQQLLALRFPRLTALDLFALVSPIVVAMAVASWHYVERPSLSRKRVLADLLSRSIDGLTGRESKASPPSKDLPDRASA